MFEYEIIKNVIVNIDILLGWLFGSIGSPCLQKKNII